jgi:hypothetical protein
MSEQKQTKSLEQLIKIYNDLTFHEKIILDQCIAFDQHSNLELTSSSNAQKTNLRNLDIHQ